MTDMIAPVPLRPRWTNRQVIAAADLTAEQAWQDAQLTRLRRLALGWGVVAGLEVRVDGDAVVIAPGYGITGAGSEIYLPQTYRWPDIQTSIAKLCGEGGNPCADPRERHTDTGASLGAWLVLVPKHVESCPRPTIPEGCAHPGSAFAYTRQGMGLRPELRCDLPDRMLRRPPNCRTIQGYLADDPVALPAVEDDLLPLAWLQCGPDGLSDVSMENRRKLLPMGVIQDLIECCNCAADIDDPEPEPDRDDGWTRPRPVPLGPLIDEIWNGLPGRRADFQRTFAEVFASEGIFTTRPTAPEPASGHTRRFAASLLVRDRAGFDAYQREEYAGVIRAILTSIRGGEARALAAIGAATIGEIWQRGEHGYALLQARQSGMMGSELAALAPTELINRFERLGWGAVAASDWMRARIIDVERR